MMRQLVENYPLSTDDIKLLFNHSDQYIIPYFQTEVKRCGLVLYNVENRDNAVDEADIMVEGLLKAGFHTKMTKWRSAEDLCHIIVAQLKQLVSQGLSLLVVSIMSHGAAGILCGSDDSTVSISDILSIFQQSLPEHVPLVSS